MILKPHITEYNVPLIDKISVAVLLPVHNGESFIKQAIETAVNQSHNNLRLIIIMDFCTDNTKKIAKQYQYLFDDKIKILKCDFKNQAAALNLGLLETKEEFVALLDVDDVWHREKIYEQLLYWFKKPVGLVATDFAKGENNNTDEWKSAWENLGYQYVDKKNVFHSLLKENFILRSSVLMPTSIINKIGGFDEDISGSDDRDLWLRVSEKYEVGILKKVLCFKTVRPEAMSNSFKSNNSRVKLWIKWHNYLKLKKQTDDTKAAYENLGIFSFNYAYLHFKKSNGNRLIAARYFLKSIYYRHRLLKSLILFFFSFIIYYDEKYSRLGMRKWLRI